MNKLGVYFGTEEREALLRGDTPNTTVNQYFVHSFQAIGMYLCGATGESPPMVKLQARYGQRAWETLIEIYKTDNQKLKCQAVLFFVHALLIMGFTAGPSLYLSKVCTLINGANLRFLPTYGRPPPNYRSKFVRTLRCSRKQYI